MGVNSVVLLELKAKEWGFPNRYCAYIIYFSANALNSRRNMARRQIIESQQSGFLIS